MTNKVARKPVRIYVIDEYPIVHLGFRYLSQKTGLVVCGHAKTPEEALSSIPRLKPDLVISEIALQGTRGIHLVKQIKALHPELPILIFSQSDESVFAERALRAGAQGFIRKQDDHRQILRAIRLAHQRKIYLSQEISDRVLQRITGAPESDGQRTLENFTHLQP